MIALLTDALQDRSLGAVAQWCAERGIGGVELGVGGYSPAPHVDRVKLLADGDARRALIDGLARCGLTIVALNASGNPLSPDDAVRTAHDAALREGIELAAALNVSRVVAMSGCPGGPGQRGGSPVFAGGAWLPDMEGLWERQLHDALGPYWAELSGWAASFAPEVSICLELHPGASIYNAASFAALREYAGPNVKVNLDPSHFWWQGIDPIATIDTVGGEAIGFVHGKDTVIYPERLRLQGALDFRWPGDPDEVAWHFCAVGAGRPLGEWRALLAHLEGVGYDGPISIEHEDPKLAAPAGIEASLAGLRSAGAGDG